MIHVTTKSQSNDLSLGHIPPSLRGWWDNSAVELETAELEPLRHYADRLGVQLVVQDGPTSIDLEWLCRRPRTPPGAGAAVLRALCSYADRTGRPVRLLVLAGRNRLITYYERFGFRVVYQAREDTDSTELLRPPLTARSARRL